MLKFIYKEKKHLSNLEITFSDVSKIFHKNKRINVSKYN